MTMNRSMPWRPGSAAGLVLAFGLCASPAPAAPATPKPPASKIEESLYKRMGGYDTLAVVTDDLMRRLGEDPKFSRLFQGASSESKNRFRQLLLDQLCAATGGPCVYLGRDMKRMSAEAGLTRAEFDAAVSHLSGALSAGAMKAAESDRAEALAAVSALESDVVGHK